MNERIRAFARAAEFSENDLHTSGDNFQRFAELIVQECTRTIAIQGMVESASSEAVKGSHAYIHQCGKISGFHDCMNLLLKNFGIKE